jgi:hypothetical protein
MERVLSSVLAALLGLAASSCGGGARPAPPAPTPPAPAPNGAPAPRSGPFVEVAPHSDFLEALSPGRVLTAQRGNVDVFASGLLQQRASASENWLEGGMVEVATGYGEGPGGELFLMTSTLIAPGPPNQGAGNLYRLSGRAWVHQKSLGYFQHGVRLSAWSHGRWLLLTHHDAEPEAQFRCSGAQADLPRLAPAPFEPRATALYPVDFRALDTGEVVVVGALRKASDPSVQFDTEWHVFMGPAPGQQQGAWERFSPGSTKGVLEALTWNGQSLLPCGVQMRSPREVWIAGTTGAKGGFAGRWDGSAWRFAAVDEPVRAFDIEPGGTMWLATDTRVLRGALGDPLEAVPLPVVTGERPPTPERIAVAGAGDVWVVLQAGFQHKLYRSGPLPPRQPLPVSAEEAALRDGRSNDPQSTASAPSDDTHECQTPFVMLFEIRDPPPSGVDYDAVARALQGRTQLTEARFIEYAHFGTRNFGARVPDAATGEKLVTALSRLGPVGGAGKPNPKLVCFLPAALGQVHFDFNAGTVASIGPP